MRYLGGSPARVVLGPALALACLAAFAGPSVASAGASASRSRHVGACNTHRSRAVKTTRRVVVWDKRSGTDPYSGGSLLTLYACLRPAGGSVPIGRNATDGDEYVGNLATSDLRITGTSVSDLFSTGLASQQACFKYQPDDPQCATAATETAQVFNLTGRRSLRQSLAAAAVAAAFSPAGAIAWEAPTSPGTAGSPLELQAVGFDPSSLKKGPVETLDTGDLGGSLQFTGLTLHWTKAGQPESLVVSDAG
jgi:hypothetical protein